MNDLVSVSQGHADTFAFINYGYICAFMSFFSASRQTETKCFLFFIQLILNTLMMIVDDEMFALPTKTM